jgi:N-methylhydantoinase B
MAAVDPVTFQVIVSRLSGIVQEMQDNIFRTGYSTIVRESQDAGCVLLDAAGNVVGEHSVIPLHITSLPGTVRAILARFGDDIHDGDAFVTNHPYLAEVTHSVDTSVVTPLLVEGRLVAFCGSIAHKSDLGGMVRGTGNGSARELFQEGTLYPPIRYMSRGVLERDIDAIIRANTRTPQLVIGDIRGQVGVARLGERRLRESIERYGLDTLLAVFADVQDRTEARIRAALRQWPDGVVEAEKRIDGAGGPDESVRFHLRVEKRGEGLLFDFTGSSDQVMMPVNVRPSIVRGAVHTAAIGLLDPAGGHNGGVDRAIAIRVRPGSILDPVFPAPTNAYMNTAMALCELSIAALSRLSRDRQVADVGGVGGGLVIAGERPEGGYFSTYELIGSAYGARTGKDGISGISVLISTCNTAPIEIMENEFPIRFRRWELVVDSGGPGTFRGGLGPVREYDLLAKEAQLTLRGGKHVVYAEGIAGGLPARRGNCIINPGRDDERALPSRFSGIGLSGGDVLRIEKSGGGGLGAPVEREFERVADDVLDGYVTRDAAVAVYGIDARRLDDRLAAWNDIDQPVHA